MAVQAALWRRFSQKAGAVRTGIILLILVGIASAAGTLILQRPLTSAEDIERAYAPQTLRVLDALGLTNVYHTWWYAALLALLAVSIIFASLERWPNAWRYYSRPYRRTDSSFRAVLPLQKSIPIADPAHAMAAAERALRSQGLRPERIAEHDEVSLYAEKSRYAVMAVYVVHASLLLIMLGGIIDGIWGYRGYVTLVPGQPPIKQVELQNGTVRKLPFAIRCDEAGQENYTGEYSMMPKRWWSKLVVLDSANGSELERKEIVVNDPLVRQGVRFYQAGYGQSSTLKSARLTITDPSTPRAQTINLTVDHAATLDNGTSIRIARFIPDAYQMDGGIYQRSRDLNAAAAELEWTRAGRTQTAWLFRSEQAAMGQVALVGPYTAAGEPLADSSRMMALLDMLPFTGLEVSHEPGQWGVWSGCILMGVGLILAFWVLHQRYWLVPVTNKDGRLVLWMGAAANKNREGFALRFEELAVAVEQELHATQAVECPPFGATSVVHS